MAQGAGFYSQRIGQSPQPRRWKYDGWARGENSYAEDNETRDDEFYNGTNIELTGRSSVRMGRRGSRLFASIPSGTMFNGWGLYKNPKTGVNYMIVQMDGRVYRITTSGTVTEIDATKTWDTAAKMRGVMLREWFYFGNGTDYMAKTNGATVTRWTNVTAPTTVSLTKTGTGTDVLYEYAVTVVTDVGETEGSTVLSIFGNATLDSSNYLSFVFQRKTDSNIKGYNIYKAERGSTMTLQTFIDQPASGTNVTFDDKGVYKRSLIYEMPTFNTTGGVKGNLFAKYSNTLFISGNPQEPDTVFYGGTGDNWESFSASDNGGWVKPGRGDGERVTAMVGFEDFLFIFKENSIWKFTFASDGGPTLNAVIPQYGTSSPDTVWRMEKDIIFLGTDGRYRVLGYEPNQLNVIRTSDISNRIQNKLDAMNKSSLDDLHGVFWEQKYIVCDRENAYPYDRRYLGFLGTWTNYTYERFLVWDRGTGEPLLFGVENGTGQIYQLLVDNTWDDDGDIIPASLRVKRIDAGEDTVLKTFYSSKIKLKNPRGRLSLVTYKDGSTLVDQPNTTFSLGGGIGEYMFGEGMFGEGVTIDTVADATVILKKDLETLEAYSIYHEVTMNANAFNHCIIQSMTGLFEVEDFDYERDEYII